MIWVVRAAFAAGILALLLLAGQAWTARPPEPATVVGGAPPVPGDGPIPDATPRPTATREAVISRMARTTPTPVPGPTVARPGPPSVAISDAGFAPAELRIRAGQRVTWRNEGLVSHDVTAVAGMAGAGAAWGSSPLAPGGTFEQPFLAAGQFDYVCSLHTVMRGRVIVEP